MVNAVVPLGKEKHSNFVHQIARSNGNADVPGQPHEPL